MPVQETQIKHSDSLSSDSQISYVPPKDVGLIWKQIKPLLLKPLEIDGFAYMPKDIFDSLLKKKMQLWISWNVKQNNVEAAIVTEIIDYPRLRSCRYFLAGGTNMKSWFNPIKEQIEQWAKLNKCQRIELVGRKGWVKWLRDYKQKHIILMKDLTNE
tara:strand:- start:542 stop:1012 length:471 start_codon:yes stop_codon:yes gene_type:complete